MEGANNAYAYLIWQNKIYKVNLSRNNARIIFSFIISFRRQD